MRNSDDQLYLVEAHEPGEREVVRAVSLKRAVVLIANPACGRGAAAADRKQAERLLSAA
ncbi:MULTISPECIES: hypothetical protein [Bradyrhizobium]|uniref:hypothetical protein n=1 Tax=Bradyrhizobium TaxID=374 RepID=UPI00155DE0D8|nr:MULTISPECIES: hypothetical protein [Bradyrhizobium]